MKAPRVRPARRRRALGQPATAQSAAFVETPIRMLQDAGYPSRTSPRRSSASSVAPSTRPPPLAATSDNDAVRDYLQLPEADPGMQQVPLIPGQTPPADPSAADPAKPSVQLPPGTTGGIDPAGTGSQ